MKATSPIDGEPSIREIIAALAAGEVIRMDEDGHCELRKPGKPIGRHTLEYHLIREGWIKSTANCGGYVLSDAGRLAYMRSTDELGTGELVAPNAGVQPTDKLLVLATMRPTIPADATDKERVAILEQFLQLMQRAILDATDGVPVGSPAAQQGGKR